jgi:hypothetical protein
MGDAEREAWAGIATMASCVTVFPRGASACIRVRVLGRDGVVRGVGMMDPERVC